MSALTDIDLLPPDVNIGQTGHEKWHDYIHSGLIAVKNLLVTLDDAAVKKTGDQTIAGIKTFTSPVVGVTPTADSHLSTKLYVDQGLSGKTNTGHTHIIANITSLQTTLDAKANLASPTFTGTVSGITKSMVGLGNVDNTADTAKPVSTLQQTALNGKVNLVTDINVAYGNNSSGVQTPILYSSGTAASTLVYRTTGGVFGAGEPTASTHVTTKNYVDTAISTAISTGVVSTSGNQTISGTKLFNNAPRLTPTSVAGYSWVASDAAGNGSWVSIANAPGGTVPWASVLGKPTTFPPDAHTHAAADIQNAAQISIAQRVEAKDWWHDHLAFGNALGAPVCEKRSFATQTWSVEAQNAINSMPFISKEASAVSMIPSGTALNDAVRWIWTSSNLAYSNITYLSYSTGYEAVARSFDVVVERSNDNGSTWIQVGADTTSESSSTRYIAIPGLGSSSNTNLRISVTRTSGTGSISFSSIKTYSYRKGNQGVGKEFELPYDWDYNRKIIFQGIQLQGNNAASGKMMLSDANGNATWSFAGTGNILDNAITTAKIADANITLPKLATTAKPYDISFVQSLDTRAVGYGEMLYGLRIPKAIVITSIRFRMGTADGSGTTTCQLYSSPTAAAANTAIANTSGTAAIDPTAVTGSFSIAAGTYLYVYTSAIGTTPGKGLICDIEAYLA